MSDITDHMILWCDAQRGGDGHRPWYEEWGRRWLMAAKASASQPGQLFRGYSTISLRYALVCAGMRWYALRAAHTSQQVSRGAT